MTSPIHGHCEHVLIAGFEEDIPAICHVLWLLPDEAYGRVFIETLREAERQTLPAPERVQVTWLARSIRASHVPSLVFADRGEPLARALAGWAGEWLPDRAERDASACLPWIGADDNAYVEAARDIYLGAIDGRICSLAGYGGETMAALWRRACRSR